MTSSPVPSSNQPPDDSPPDEVAEARREQLTLYAVAAIALLFFCFVVLPLMIQLLGTPRPDR
jgi:hypothetical protein